MSKRYNYLSNGNSKLKKSGIFSWGIPAFLSKSGFKTCPMAGICVKGCYAKQGTYTWSNVAQAYEKRLDFSFNPLFVMTIIDEIKRRKVKRLRLHDSGDFYGDDYLNRWLKIIKACPDTLFYAYTKQVAMFKALGDAIPDNFVVIFSEGGKQDALIDTEQDRHSRVFSSLEDLIDAGYSDASQDDTVAFGPDKKIGLIYHGAKVKSWSTDKDDRTKKIA